MRETVNSCKFLETRAWVRKAESSTVMYTRPPTARQIQCDVGRLTRAVVGRAATCIFLADVGKKWADALRDFIFNAERTYFFFFSQFTRVLAWRGSPDVCPLQVSKSFASDILRGVFLLMGLHIVATRQQRPHACACHRPPTLSGNAKPSDS